MNKVQNVKELLKRELSEIEYHTEISGNDQCQKPCSRPCTESFQSLTPKLIGTRYSAATLAKKCTIFKDISNILHHMKR